MAQSKVDRNVSYMKENWRTTSLITDYTPSEQKVIQEVVYDSEIDLKKIRKKELFETNCEDDLTYGIEPSYKIDENQKLLRE